MDHHKPQMKSKKDKNNLQNFCVHAAFFLCAVVIYGILNVQLTAAQDILAGSNAQTSTVLFAILTPYTVVNLSFPFFAKRVPYIVRFLIVILFLVTAFVSLGLVHSVYWKLAAVSLASFAAILAELSCLGLTSYFKASVLSWYSAGTGFGLVLAPLYYTAMTTWFCVFPGTALQTFAPFSLLLPLCYFFIQKEITKDGLKTTKNSNEIAYSKVDNSDSENNEGEIDAQTQTMAQKSNNQGVLTWNEKLSAFKKLIFLIGVPVFVSFFTEYMFFQSIITTIAYPSSPFPPRDHYQYYSVSLMMGEILGRSNRSVLEMVKPDWLYRPTTLLLWILAVIEICHLLLFFCESWFRFFPSVGFALFFCFTAGSVIGMVYSNCLEIVRDSFEGNEREFVLALALLPLNLGTFTASLIGLSVEPDLVKHCISFVMDSRYCFTRPANMSSVVQSCQGRL